MVVIVTVIRPAGAAGCGCGHGAGGVVVVRLKGGDEAGHSDHPTCGSPESCKLACVCESVLVSVHLLWDKPASILWGEVRTLQEDLQKHREAYSVSSLAYLRLSSLFAIFCALERLVGL